MKEPSVGACVRTYSDDLFEAVFEVINDGAWAFKGAIPADRWREPYMPRSELRAEMAAGVEFLCAWLDGRFVGAMGLQHKSDVDLIRHAYVRMDTQRKGIGAMLLRSLREQSDRPILLGTWAAATWAIDFYRRNGFRLLDASETASLLRTYWDIPERQVATSVVLADSRWTRDT